MTWIEKELQTYESAGTVEVENRILLRLFEMWKSEQGRQRDLSSKSATIDTQQKKRYMIMINPFSSLSGTMLLETV